MPTKSQIKAELADQIVPKFLQYLASVSEEERARLIERLARITCRRLTISELEEWLVKLDRS